MSDKIFEYSGSRNLSSSPISITGLKGDTYDYEFIIFCDSSNDITSGNPLKVTLNSDTGLNYNTYDMEGSTSTASAGVSTGQNSFSISNFCRNDSSRNSLAIGSLTGESGDTRKFSFQESTGYYPRVHVYDSYWTNTADEVDEITFTGLVSASYTWHIIVYRNKKESDQGRWQLMGTKTLSWSSESTEKSFTGLDGDVDGEYKIVWDGDQELNLELNNDTTTYTRQYLQNAGGTISAANSTSQSSIVSDGINSTFIIQATTGVKRLVTTSGSNSSSAQQSQRAHWYDDTATNITTIDCTPSASATGTAKIYKRINRHKSGDTLPFQDIKTVDVSGDFSAGHTFSGLTGDSTKLYKINGLFSTVGNDLQVQFNSNTGSVYTHQTLKGVGSSASAATSTGTFALLCDASASKVASFDLYIYPKSGEARPCLLRVQHGEDSVEFKALWYTETATELTSIKVYASSTTTTTGNIKLSRLNIVRDTSGVYNTLLLNGSTQYLEIADNNLLEIGGSDFTMSAWVYPTAFSASAMSIFDKYFDGAYYSYLMAWYNSDNTMRFYFSTNGALDASPNTFSWSPSLNTWYHVALEREGDLLRFYVNGVQQGSDQALTGSAYNNTSQLTLFSYNNGANLPAYSHEGSASTVIMTSSSGIVSELYNSGVIKQPLEYSQAIQDSYILALPLNNGVASGQEFEDYSGNELNPTPIGSPTITGAEIEWSL